MKKYLIISLAIVVLTVTTAFAWFVSSDQAINRVGAGEVDIQIVEIFTPPVNWQPGAQTIKQVAVRNETTTAAFVRVRLDEAAIFWGAAQLFDAPPEHPISAGFTPASGWERVTNLDAPEHIVVYAHPNAAYISRCGTLWGYEFRVMSSDYGRVEHGLLFVENGHVVIDFVAFWGREVRKAIAANHLSDTTVDEIMWTFAANTNWHFYDGWFYFQAVLENGETTANLLESVMLCALLPPELAANIDYRLIVTAEAVQATRDAVVALWGDGAATALGV